MSIIMKLITFILIIIISILIFTLSSFFIKKLNKNILFTFVCTLMITHIIVNPSLCLNSTLTGLNLFIKSVFVYIFPFLSLINIMLSYDAVHIYSNMLGNILCKPLRLPKSCSIVIIISILCGYPLGTKYACELYEKNIIDFDTCQRLISIASNPSPLFIIGSVGNSMLKNNHIGWILLFSCYISCFIISLFIKPNATYKIKGNESLVDSALSKEVNLGNVLKKSIDNALKTSVSIGGFIIFFSVLSSLIKNNIFFDIVFKKISIVLNLDLNIFKNLLLGIIEMTNGCNLISLTNISLTHKIVFISFFLGFSGFSIISQAYSIIYKYNFSIKLYINIKFLQGILCSFLSVLFYKLNVLNLTNLVFSHNTFYTTFLTPNIIYVISLIFLVLPFLFHKLLDVIS